MVQMMGLLKLGSHWPRGKRTIELVLGLGLGLGLELGLEESLGAIQLQFWGWSSQNFPTEGAWISSSMGCWGGGGLMWGIEVREGGDFVALLGWADRT